MAPSPGHVEGVGFDLYVRMVSDAVAAYRGDAPAEEADVRMDLQVDAHIPEGYVRGERLRLEVYAKIAATTTPEQEKDVREELVQPLRPDSSPGRPALRGRPPARDRAPRGDYGDCHSGQVPARLALSSCATPR